MIPEDYEPAGFGPAEHQDVHLFYSWISPVWCKMFVVFITIEKIYRKQYLATQWRFQYFLFNVSFKIIQISYLLINSLLTAA